MPSSEEEGGGAEEDGDTAYPSLVMIDQAHGNRYMRVVDQKGLGDNGEMQWLVKDLHEELKSWGFPGGGDHRVILKTDGEPAVVALREALSKLHGGVVSPEQPPKG